MFEGEYGTEYAFYVLGVDRTGNREIKNGAEATSEILPRQEILSLIHISEPTRPY